MLPRAYKREGGMQQLVSKNQSGGRCSNIYTVEPRLSGTSIIRLGSFIFIRSENGRVPKMRMRIAAVTMETCLLIFCACTDNHLALLCSNKVGGSLL